MSQREGENRIHRLQRTVEPHHESFKAFIPKDIDFTFVQEEGAGGSLYDTRGKVDSLVGQTMGLVEKHGWDGVIISGWPQKCSIPDCGVVFPLR